MLHVTPEPAHSTPFSHSQGAVHFRFTVKKVPAVVLCDSTWTRLQVAGLGLLDRLVITLHRAGCAPIIVECSGTEPLERAQALGIDAIFVPVVPELDTPALIVTGGVLVESRDVERVIQRSGQLISASGTPLPVQMSTSDPPPVTAGGVAVAINDRASAEQAERQLWRSLRSNADGLVDRYFNRPVGRILSKALVNTPISPNHVSIVSILIGVASGWLFAQGAFLFAAIVLQICAIIDCVDGDLARALFKQSALGKWLDLGGDQVVHFAVFAGIGIGVARVNPSVPALALGGSAAIGVLLCFAVVVRGMKMPAERRSQLLGKIVDATANRDFSVLLLILALIGKMEWFLWLAGIGIHVFWMLMLILQQTSRRNGRSGVAAQST